MGNVIAIKIWTHHGNEVLCEERSHVNLYELTSMSAIAGCMPRAVRGGDDGILSWKQIEPGIRPKIYYDSQTALVCLENSSNMAGGTVYPTARVDEICDRAHVLGLKVHLDGARIFNAATALGDNVANMTKKVDSVMFCLSKGLGAPVGLMILRVPRIHRAGSASTARCSAEGMRQVGIVAAAGLLALEHSPSRLHEDHANARHLAEGVAKILLENRSRSPWKTTTVILDCSDSGMNSVELCDALHERGIWAQDTAFHSVRMVTHWNVSRAGIDRAIQELNAVVQRKKAR